MKPFRLAFATTVATWILLLIGGLVNPMGASMACPDWYFIPTCNGELLPEMTEIANVARINIKGGEEFVCHPRMGQAS